MRLPFEQGRRRRIYLMRHAQAEYVRPDGTRAPDPRTVPLTPRGREEALAMADWLGPVPFDKAVCSGLPRTVETAQLVLGGRELHLHQAPLLEEIRGAGLEERAALQPADYAYAMFAAAEPGARFALGESFSAFQARVLTGFVELLDDTNWTDMLLVCHGGTNRAILTWFLGLGLDAFGAFEQDSCCLNILDFDQMDGTHIILRKVLRGVNLTVQDTAKVNSRTLTMEGLARAFAEARRPG